MNALWEVIKDLWQFAFGLSTVRQPESIKTDDEPSTGIPTWSFVDGVPDSQKVTMNTPNQSLGRTAYVRSYRVDCMAEPKTGFDLRVGELFFGDIVSVTHTNNDGYAAMQTSSFEGWVPAHALTDNQAEVFPELLPGDVLTNQHEHTIRIRKYLRDEMSGDELDMTMQSAEFILYLLKKSSVSIEWPNDRPRIAGRWQNILRGVRGVTMTIEPKTGSVLERVSDETMHSFLGYVESVRPDGSITLRSVGRETEGEYTIDSLTRDEWKEWRPVFISFQ